MLKEFQIAHNINHPNIIKYHKFLTKITEKAHEVNIILELLEGGNLKQLMTNNHGMFSYSFILQASR